MPKSGCPEIYNNWEQGYSYQDSENSANDNQWSYDNHFPSVGANVHNYFCMKTKAAGYSEWPKGEYCIFAKDGCPNGFSCGFIQWDDEDENNQNDYNGTLPDGIYDDDTLIRFACRCDGAV